MLEAPHLIKAPPAFSVGHVGQAGIKGKTFENLNFLKTAALKIYKIFF
jgi:hypothetical protein